MNEVLVYIDSFDSDKQVKLLQLRKLILAKIPDASEVISWRMPTYRKKHNIIHFACFKNHIGIYPGSEVVLKMAPKLTKYSFSKGSIQIPLTEELPVNLINEIIDEAIKLNS